MHKKLALAVLALVLALCAGAVIPYLVKAALPTNDWLGLRGPSANGVLARCALGGARSTDVGSSVWAAATGEASLDIIQIGAKVTPQGRHYFVAWGRGEPNAAGSMYEERDLGPVNTLFHKYTVQLIKGSWSLSIDGVTRIRVPDTFRTWVIRSSQVAHETEGTGDPFGGTALKPVQCKVARVNNGGWITPAWSIFGAGSKAAAAKGSFGTDWFKIW